jgi:hypothetical protein
VFGKERLGDAPKRLLAYRILCAHPSKKSPTTAGATGMSRSSPKISRIPDEQIVTGARRPHVPPGKRRRVLRVLELDAVDGTAVLGVKPTTRALLALEKWASPCAPQSEWAVTLAKPEARGFDAPCVVNRFAAAKYIVS